MYANCPKCGHAPLPKAQASPAACPACGIILAKFAGAAAPAVNSSGRVIRDEELEDDPSLPARIAAMFVHVPDQVYRMYWMARIATLAVFIFWTVWIFKSIDVPDGVVGSWLLHSIIIPFHEAGHVLLRWAPEFFVYLGGSLGQLAMPIILAGALLIKRGDPFGAALFAWLLGFALIDMAVYMYDAYDPHMMLLTGYTGAESANHDFIQVFGDLNLLNKARGIGQFFAVLGRGVMIASLAWAGFILWKQRARLSDSPLAEPDT